MHEAMGGGESYESPNLGCAGFKEQREREREKGHTEMERKIKEFSN